MIKNYYGILGVEPSSSEEEIKKAYRKLAFEWHPDKHQQSDEQKKTEAEERFKEISEAYAVLSDTEKRRNYDASGDPNGASFNFRTSGDPFDIFSRFGFNFRPHQQGQARSLRGQNVQILQDIPLVAALFGTELEVRYSVSSPCETCDGRGATEFELCDTCKGSGFIVNRQQNMIMQHSCDVCRGVGQKPKNQCSTCRGQGLIQDERQVTVQIPAGVHPGATLRLTGQGGKGFRGGATGDLLLQLRVIYPDLSGLTDEERNQLSALLTK
jgi:molecular chaperone DnaJ